MNSSLMAIPYDTKNLPGESPHYVQSVADLGEQQDVVAQDDIYADNGVKLVSKGTHINRKQCERLRAHKLRVPLDFVLSAERSVTGALLASDINQMFVEDPGMERLARRSGDPHGLRHEISALAFPRPLLFRMTVMREQRGGLYQHSLRVAAIVHAMALRLKLSERDRQHVLMAGLCHDLGEMHTDPLILAQGHKITAEERRFVLVHPITGYVVLKDMHGIPAETLQAVLHHHERLDGSGYPYGLKEAQISPLGKLLCVAEVTEGVVRRADLQRLDVLLRLNHSRFDPAVVNVIRDLLHGEITADIAAPLSQDASVKLTHVTEVIGAWPAMHTTLKAQSQFNTILPLIADRMVMLRSVALQSGIDPGDVEVVLEIARQDPSILNELRATLDELDWLMLDIANEIERHYTKVNTTPQLAIAELMDLLRMTV